MKPFTCRSQKQRSFFRISKGCFFLIVIFCLWGDVASQPASFSFFNEKIKKEGSFVSLQGSPMEMGMQYGKKLADPIKVNLELFFQEANLQGFSREDLLQKGENHKAFLKEIRPDILIEIEGMALASGTAFEELLAFNAFQEVIFNDGCTNLLASGSATKTGRVYFHKNRDTSGSPEQVIIERLSGSHHKYVGITSAGSSGLSIGMNEYGVSTGNTALTTDDTGSGFGNLDINRMILEEAGSVAEGVSFVKSLQRSRGSNYHISDRYNALFMETTHSAAQEKWVVNDAVSRTNHYTLEEMLEYEGSTSVGSRDRYHRANELLLADKGNIDHHTMIAISRDRHGSYPISRVSTVAAATFDNSHLLMYYQIGRPSSTNPVITYDFGEHVNGTLRGVIYHGNDINDMSKRIPGAAVRLCSNLEVITNSEGAFVFETGPGNYTITASKPGYLDSGLERTVATNTTTWGSIQLSAAPDAVTYYVGAPGTAPNNQNPHYPTLKTAFEDLMTTTATGDVTFLITSDITETENIALGYDPGTNHAITVKPAPGKQPVISFTQPNNNSTYYGALIIGLADIDGNFNDLTRTRNIVIDGSNTIGGTTRDLTLTSTTAAAGGNAIRILGDADNIQIKNTRIEMNQSASAFNALRITPRSQSIPRNILIENNEITNFAATSARAITVDETASPVSAPDITIRNNDLFASRYGIWLRNNIGSILIEGNSIEINQNSGYESYGILVEDVINEYQLISLNDNHVVNSNSNSTFTAIACNSNATYEIKGNTLQNLSSAERVTGILVNAGRKFSITENKLLDLNGSEGVRMIEIANNIPVNHDVFIANNIIGGFGSNASGGKRLDGLYIASPDGAHSDIKVYHNTIVMNPLDVLGSGWSYYGLSVFSNSRITLDLKNNILINNDDNGTEVNSKIYRQAWSTPLVNMTSDYNLWFVDSPDAPGTTWMSRHGDTETRTTLFTNHQTHTGFDDNSISKNVFFKDLENHDYRMANASLNDNDLLVPRLASVTKDINGKNRASLTFMGAYEGNGEPVSTERIVRKPKSLELSQNYPNPFNPVTTLSYSLPSDHHVRLTIYDVTGRQVVLLVDELQASGHHQIQWDASSFSSGVYLTLLEADGEVLMRRMTLLK